MLGEEQLNKTPLFADHVALKARMAPFGGWEMPIQYDGILKEHTHTREAVSIFDISHMGEFIVEGHYAASGLDRIVTMSLFDLPVKSCRYGCILNDHGGVIDDLIVFRIEEEKWFIVANGATMVKDAAHFQKYLTDKAVFKNISMQTGKIDVQGPASREALCTLVDGLDRLKYYTFDFFDLLGERVLISRTGYTGELGYEIYFPWGKTLNLWHALISIPQVKPAGLGARDVLRLEMGYSLYGHELSEDVSPLESGLNRFVHFEKDFIGLEALLKEKERGLSKKIVGIRSSNRRAPREHNRIYLPSGEEVGVVTSGTFSPCLKAGIGLAFVSLPHSVIGQSILFGDDKSKNDGNIDSRFFYQSGSLKS